MLYSAMERRSSWQLLPNELWLKIAEFLRTPDAARLTQVDKNLCALAAHFTCPRNFQAIWVEHDVLRECLVKWYNNGRARACASNDDEALELLRMGVSRGAIIQITS